MLAKNWYIALYASIAIILFENASSVVFSRITKSFRFNPIPDFCLSVVFCLYPLISINQLFFVMKISDIPFNLTDKIFQIKFNSDHSIEKIISYFPLAPKERSMLNSISGQDDFSNFHSIFSDTVTDDEWDKTKEQIKKRFQNELFDIDN